jgi:hypothetical protein
VPRAVFTKESWTLEPPDVMALLDKIKRNGLPLTEYAGVKPYRGVLTGLNEAFLIDTPAREQLVRADPACAEIIKPYLRGQDIERWHAPWNGLWMIFARRGIDIEHYPSVKRHLECFRMQLEPKPPGWKPQREDDEWPGRKEGAYAWYEIQDSVDYWKALESPKILYGDIAWSASFAMDTTGLFSNNSGYFVPTGDPWVVAVLNAPIGWWFSWRRAQHGKDEALRYFNTFMEDYPIASAEIDASELVAEATRWTALIRTTMTVIHDWLRHEFGVEKPNRALAVPHALDADGFVTAVRATLPKSRKWTAAEIAQLKKEYAATIEPARVAAAEMLTLERGLSDLVNAAYDLTPEEVALMWRTAPPRMPLDPAAELARMN